MLGTIVNTFTVLIGGIIGLIFRKLIPENFGDSIMKGLALCVLYVGISGALKGNNTLVIIISMVLGTITGELLDLDGKLNSFAVFIEKKLKKGKNGSFSIAEGFVASTLLFCVGAMAIVGSLESGLSGNHNTIFSKSAMDGISALIFASQMGAGVLLSSICILVYQGAIVLISQWIAPFLGESVIAAMTCSGSLLIIGLSFNMLGITKFKIVNYLPSIIFAGAITAVMSAVI